MILVVGGRYQGKLQFVLEKFGKTEDDVNFCKFGEEIDLKKDVIYMMEEWIRKEISKGRDFDDMMNIIGQKDFSEKIIVFTDISQGIVPIDKEKRKFRDYTGKIIVGLAKDAETVYRVFCGIPTKIK